MVVVRRLLQRTRQKASLFLSRDARTLMSGALLLLLILVATAGSDNIELPMFGNAINNVTVPVGREAYLICTVDNLASYKVAWLRIETQTILTIHSHVITKNRRIGVTHSDPRTWNLHIRDVQESDRGWYMCQINTDPMKSQAGYLNVVVPPDILDHPTSTDMVVREGSTVALTCAASGSPHPSINWRREAGEPIVLNNGSQVMMYEGPVLNISRVNRLHMGAYLCIASNGVPPSVSKRIVLIVHFPPMISVPNQLVGAREGQQLSLECHSEAYPKSINYWTRDKGQMIFHGANFEPEMLDKAYRVVMKLNIRAIYPSDFGVYMCVAKNALGVTDGSIKVYKITDDNSIRLNAGAEEIGDDEDDNRVFQGSNPKRMNGKSGESSTLNNAENSPMFKSDFLLVNFISLVLLNVLRYFLY